MDYVGEVDPILEWEARGISAHNQQEKAELKQQRRNAKQLLSTEQGQKKINSFLQECSTIFHKLLYEDKIWLEDYFSEKRFIFVIGAMRTAGTYLYTELSKIRNIDWKNLSIKMTHDSIPTYGYLEGWEKPNRWLPLMFEMAQFLTWAKRECSEQNVIIQKRIAYGHALPVLNNLFGDKASYVITVRHPGAIAKSFQKMEGIDMKNTLEPPLWKEMAKQRKGISYSEWEKLSYNERILIYWQIYYEDVVKYGLPEGNITVLGYGKEEYEGFLSDFADKNNNKEYTLTKFNVSDKQYSDFWDSEQVNEIINQVKLWWQIHGFEFPEVELR
ncbi:hypothetical protein JCM16358_19400 [Halanaerocella petrolearia]